MILLGRYLSWTGCLLGRYLSWTGCLLGRYLSWTGCLLGRYLSWTGCLLGWYLSWTGCPLGRYLSWTGCLLGRYLSWTGCLFPREPPAGRHYTALSELIISSASRERERDLRDVHPLQLEHTESLSSDEGIPIHNTTISRGNSCSVLFFVYLFLHPTLQPCMQSTCNTTNHLPVSGKPKQRTQTPECVCVCVCVTGFGKFGLNAAKNFFLYPGVKPFGSIFL